MPLLPPATAGAFADRARRLLKDAAELTSGNDPNYIRDAQPESIFERIPLAAARQGCRRYADNPSEYSGRRQARVERACRPYLDDIGYGSPPSIDQPFRGGQCPGVNYVVNLRFYRVDGSVFGDGQQSGPGPVTVVPSGTQAPPPGTPACPIGQTYKPGRALAFNGVERISWGGGCAVRETTEILSIVRSDGLSDDCGSQPPLITDPFPPLTPGPPVEPFNPSPDIDIDIGVEIKPDLTIDVDFGTGPINIDPFGDDPEAGGGSEGPGSPGAPGDTGQGGGTEGEAGEGEVLTGLRIDFLEPPIGGKEYAPGVYRGVCYIYMGTADGLDHDPAGAMLRDGQFVYAEKDYLTRWRVEANMGYNLRVTPYYRPSEGEG